MLGTIGTLLLVAWIFDYALAFAPGFVQLPLLVLACVFLASDFVRSQMAPGDHRVAYTTPSQRRSSSPMP